MPQIYLFGIPLLATFFVLQQARNRLLMANTNFTMYIETF